MGKGFFGKGVENSCFHANTLKGGGGGGKPRVENRGSLEKGGTRRTRLFRNEKALGTDLIERTKQYRDGEKSDIK